MKKTFKNRLTLDRETVRPLTDAEAASAHGAEGTTSKLTVTFTTIGTIMTTATTVLTHSVVGNCN